MTERLLPCPFCGGEAIRCGNNEDNPRHWIMCRNCHACPGGDVPDRLAAETAWNTRAATADVDAAAAIVLGAAVLTRIENPAAREIAIRNALTMAMQNPSPQPREGRL